MPGSPRAACHPQTREGVQSITRCFGHVRAGRRGAGWTGDGCRPLPLAGWWCDGMVAGSSCGTGGLPGGMVTGCRMAWRIPLRAVPLAGSSLAGGMDVPGWWSVPGWLSGWWSAPGWREWWMAGSPEETALCANTFGSIGMACMPMAFALPRYCREVFAVPRYS